MKRIITLVLAAVIFCSFAVFAQGGAKTTTNPAVSTSTTAKVAKKAKVSKKVKKYKASETETMKVK